MMVSGILLRGKRKLDALTMEPGIRLVGAGAVYGGGALVISAIGCGGVPIPAAAVLAAVSPGWQNLAALLGAGIGYRLFWPGRGGVLWTALAFFLGLALRAGEKTDFFPLAAGGVMIPALTGTLLRLPVWEWGLQSALGGLYTGLFFLLHRTKEPIAFWAAGALGVRGLMELRAVPLACFLAGAGCGCVPGAVLLGLALETAGKTGMTAGLCGALLLRNSPLPESWRRLAAPAAGALLGMLLGKQWDLGVFLGVSLGGAAAAYIPWQPLHQHSGTARVQLEQAARALGRMQRGLLELPEEIVNPQDAVEKLRQDACEECPKAEDCRQRLEMDDTPFRDPLAFSCPRTGRVMRSARRVREQMRLVQMQHRRLREYRMALAQQYGMLSLYLQRVADRLPLGDLVGRIRYRVAVSVRSREKRRVDGDRCAAFPGLGARFYILLCDGMGTGSGAAVEASRALKLVREMLTAGLSPRYAMGSLNSQLVLTGQSGAVTVDLAEVRLDTGRASLYKWGAAPSWLLRRKEAVKLGQASPPPGLDLSEGGERVARLSLCRGETLVLASDGVAFGETLSPPEGVWPTGALAEMLLKNYAAREDDATVAVIRLEPLGHHE